MTLSPKVAPPLLPACGRCRHPRGRKALPETASPPSLPSWGGCSGRGGGAVSNSSRDECGTNPPPT